MTSPVTWVMAPSRCTFLRPPALASLRSLPSTPTAGRAGRYCGSPVTAGSSHGCPGAARTRLSRVSRSASPAGGLRRRLLVPPLFFLPAARAATRAASAGSSATGARHADSPASSSSASSRASSRPSVDADGGSCSPVTGLRRVPCAASTSWSQPAAAPAIARMLEYPHATPATSTDTSEPSECRIPRGLRGSASRAASTSRSDARAAAGGASGAPAPPDGSGLLDQR